MSRDLALRRKWTLRAHGRQMIFVKKPNEQTAHVVMKALVWGLYLPEYPDLSVEISLADRYKPDVVSLGDDRRPRFWGEAGQVSPIKIRSLAKRYRATHLAIGKWATRLSPHLTMIEKATAGIERSAPIDLIIFPEDAAERFIDESGEIRLTHDDLEWRRLGPR
ncbi:MAG TPA: hypothetical protein VFI31_30360 [Pirellulales bacterium]|nr:hypothetical protein [Pirellulales bacterium]